MNECLRESDLLELSRGSLDAFEQRLTSIPADLCAPFHEEARQLEAELLTVYRVVVQCTKREEDLERVSKWWETMVRVCDEFARSEEHTSELQSPYDLVCRLLLEKKNKTRIRKSIHIDIRSTN